ncbi:MAG: acetyl-CoA hydrolase/transferase C-terminal domain-containing protein [Thermoanaerobaculia bacterium]
MSVAGRLPPELAARVVPQEQALLETVRSGTRIASGFATSEPHTFYASLWDHVRDQDLTDLTITQGLFMAPHPLLVGAALEPLVELAGEPKGTSLFAGLKREIKQAVAKAETLQTLVAHYEELRERRVRFVSGFLSPAVNTIVPDNVLTRSLYPEWAGRNLARSGILSWQSVHFPDAPDALVQDPETSRLMDADLFVLVATPPDERGRLSHGPANGANAEALDLALRDGKAGILLYLNTGYPFTDGHPESPNTISVEELVPAARDGRLWIVEDSGPIPALPADAFEHPDPDEIRIAEHVVNHIEMHPQLTRGRALQVGIGGTGVLAVRRLADSGWSGRVYTEMFEPYTMELMERNKLAGSHFVTADGRREQLDGKLVCTFALGRKGDGFYEALDRHPAVLLSAASRVVVPEAFYYGLGINNILGIDFHGHVNSTGRDVNPHSGVGGVATILRGLARGGVAYLCLKSTHRTPDGEERSSIFPFLPEGTPVTLIGPDLMGTREGARTFLVTEHGIAELSARSQERFIRALLSVAHPDHREWLARRAWEEFRVA